MRWFLVRVTWTQQRAEVCQSTSRSTAAQRSDRSMIALVLLRATVQQVFLSIWLGGTCMRTTCNPRSVHSCLCFAFDDCMRTRLCTLAVPWMIASTSLHVTLLLGLRRLWPAWGIDIDTSRHTWDRDRLNMIEAGCEAGSACPKLRILLRRNALVACRKTLVWVVISWKRTHAFYPQPCVQPILEYPFCFCRAG